MTQTEANAFAEGLYDGSLLDFEDLLAPADPEVALPGVPIPVEAVIPCTGGGKAAFSGNATVSLDEARGVFSTEVSGTLTADGCTFTSDGLGFALDTESGLAQPFDAVTAVVRTAIAGYTEHGSAYLPNRSLAVVVGARHARSVADMIALGGKHDDFFVHVRSGEFKCRGVAISVVLEGLHPERYRELGGRDTWSHSYHYVAALREDGSWAVHRKSGFTS